MSRPDLALALGPRSNPSHDAGAFVVREDLEERWLVLGPGPRPQAHAVAVVDRPFQPELEPLREAIRGHAEPRPAFGKHARWMVQRAWKAEAPGVGVGEVDAVI